jgi:hypothetical protein
MNELKKGLKRLWTKIKAWLFDFFKGPEAKRHAKNITFAFSIVAFALMGWVVYQAFFPNEISEIIQSFQPKEAEAADNSGTTTADILITADACSNSLNRYGVFNGKAVLISLATDNGDGTYTYGGVKSSYVFVDANGSTKFESDYDILVTGNDDCEVWSPAGTEPAAQNASLSFVEQSDSESVYVAGYWDYSGTTLTGAYSENGLSNPRFAFVWGNLGDVVTGNNASWALAQDVASAPLLKFYAIYATANVSNENYDGGTYDGEMEFDSQKALLAYLFGDQATDSNNVGLTDANGNPVYRGNSRFFSEVLSKVYKSSGADNSGNYVGANLYGNFAGEKLFSSDDYVSSNLGSYVSIKKEGSSEAVRYYIPYLIKLDAQAHQDGNVYRLYVALPTLNGKVVSFDNATGEAGSLGQSVFGREIFAIDSDNFVPASFAKKGVSLDVFKGYEGTDVRKESYENLLNLIENGNVDWRMRVGGYDDFGGYDVNVYETVYSFNNGNVVTVGEDGTITNSKPGKLAFKADGSIDFSAVAVTVFEYSDGHIEAYVNGKVILSTKAGENSDGEAGFYVSAIAESVYAAGGALTEDKALFVVAPSVDLASSAVMLTRQKSPEFVAAYKDSLADASYGGSMLSSLWQQFGHVVSGNAYGAVRSSSIGWMIGYRTKTLVVRADSSAFGLYIYKETSTGKYYGYWGDNGDVEYAGMTEVGFLNASSATEQIKSAAGNRCSLSGATGLSGSFCIENAGVVFEDYSAIAGSYSAMNSYKVRISENTPVNIASAFSYYSLVDSSTNDFYEFDFTFTSTGSDYNYNANSSLSAAQYASLNSETDKVLVWNGAYNVWKYGSETVLRFQDVILFDDGSIGYSTQKVYAGLPIFALIENFAERGTNSYDVPEFLMLNNGINNGESEATKLTWSEQLMSYFNMNMENRTEQDDAWSTWSYTTTSGSTSTNMYSYDIYALVSYSDETGSQTIYSDRIKEMADMTVASYNAFANKKTGYVENLSQWILGYDASEKAITADDYVASAGKQYADLSYLLTTKAGRAAIFRSNYVSFSFYASTSNGGHTSLGHAYSVLSVKNVYTSDDEENGNYAFLTNAIVESYTNNGTTMTAVINDNETVMNDIANSAENSFIVVRFRGAAFYYQKLTNVSFIRGGRTVIEGKTENNACVNALTGGVKQIDGDGTCSTAEFELPGFYWWKQDGKNKWSSGDSASTETIGIDGQNYKIVSSIASDGTPVFSNDKVLLSGNYFVYPSSQPWLYDVNDEYDGDNTGHEAFITNFAEKESDGFYGTHYSLASFVGTYNEVDISYSYGVYGSGSKTLKFKTFQKDQNPSVIFGTSRGFGVAETYSHPNSKAIGAYQEFVDLSFYQSISSFARIESAYDKGFLPVNHIYYDTVSAPKKAGLYSGRTYYSNQHQYQYAMVSYGRWNNSYIDLLSQAYGTAPIVDDYSDSELPRIFSNIKYAGNTLTEMSERGVTCIRPYAEYLQIYTSLPEASKLRTSTTVAVPFNTLISTENIGIEYSNSKMASKSGKIFKASVSNQDENNKSTKRTITTLLYTAEQNGNYLMKFNSFKNVWIFEAGFGWTDDLAMGMSLDDQQDMFSILEKRWSGGVSYYERTNTNKGMGGGYEINFYGVFSKACGNLNCAIGFNGGSVDERDGMTLGDSDTTLYVMAEQAEYTYGINTGYEKGTVNAKNENEFIKLLGERNNNIGSFIKDSMSGLVPVDYYKYYFYTDYQRKYCGSIGVWEKYDTYGCFLPGGSLVFFDLPWTMKTVSSISDIENNKGYLTVNSVYSGKEGVWTTSVKGIGSNEGNEANENIDETPEKIELADLPVESWTSNVIDLMSSSRINGLASETKYSYTYDTNGHISTKYHDYEAQVYYVENGQSNEKHYVSDFSKVIFADYVDGGKFYNGNYLKYVFSDDEGEWAITGDDYMLTISDMKPNAVYHIRTRVRYNGGKVSKIFDKVIVTDAGFVNNPYGSTLYSKYDSNDHSTWWALPYIPTDLDVCFFTYNKNDVAIEGSDKTTTSLAGPYEEHDAGVVSNVGSVVASDVIAMCDQIPAKYRLHIKGDLSGTVDAALLKFEGLDPKAVGLSLETASGASMALPQASTKMVTSKGNASIDVNAKGSSSASGYADLGSDYALMAYDPKIGSDGVTYWTANASGAIMPSYRSWAESAGDAASDPIANYFLGASKSDSGSYAPNFNIRMTGSGLSALIGKMYYLDYSYVRSGAEPMVYLDYDQNGVLTTGSIAYGKYYNRDGSAASSELKTVEDLVHGGALQNVAAKADSNREGTEIVYEGLAQPWKETERLSFKVVSYGNLYYLAMVMGDGKVVVTR